MRQWLRRVVGKCTLAAGRVFVRRHLKETLRTHCSMSRSQAIRVTDVVMRALDELGVEYRQ